MDKERIDVLEALVAALVAVELKDRPNSWVGQVMVTLNVNHGGAVSVGSEVRCTYGKEAIERLTHR